MGKSSVIAFELGTSGALGRGWAGYICISLAGLKPRALGGLGTPLFRFEPLLWVCGGFWAGGGAGVPPRSPFSCWGGAGRSGATKRCPPGSDRQGVLAGSSWRGGRLDLGAGWGSWMNKAPPASLGPAFRPSRTPPHPEGAGQVDLLACKPLLRLEEKYGSLPVTVGMGAWGRRPWPRVLWASHGGKDVQGESPPYPLALTPSLTGLSEVTVLRERGVTPNGGDGHGPSHRFPPFLPALHFTYF